MSEMTPQTFEGTPGRSGFDPVRVTALLERGLPVQNVARMSRCTVAEVERTRQSLNISAPPLGPARRVLSLWRGEILVAVRTSWRDIAHAVAERHGVPFDQLVGPARCKEVSRARQEAFALIYEAGQATSTQIGWWFGDRDHSTVLHGIRKHKARVEAAKA